MAARGIEDALATRWRGVGCGLLVRWVRPRGRSRRFVRSAM